VTRPVEQAEARIWWALSSQLRIVGGGYVIEHGLIEIEARLADVLERQVDGWKEQATGHENVEMACNWDGRLRRFGGCVTWRGGKAQQTRQGLID